MPRRFPIFTTINKEFYVEIEKAKRGEIIINREPNEILKRALYIHSTKYSIDDEKMNKFTESPLRVGDIYIPLMKELLPLLNEVYKDKKYYRDFIRELRRRKLTWSTISSDVRSFLSYKKMKDADENLIMINYRSLAQLKMEAENEEEFEDREDTEESEEQKEGSKEELEGSENIMDEINEYGKRNYNSQNSSELCYDVKMEDPSTIAESESKSIKSFFSMMKNELDSEPEEKFIDENNSLVRRGVAIKINTEKKENESKKKNFHFPAFIIRDVKMKNEVEPEPFEEFSFGLLKAKIPKNLGTLPDFNSIEEIPDINLDKFSVLNREINFLSYNKCDNSIEPSNQSNAEVASDMEYQYENMNIIISKRSPSNQ